MITASRFPSVLGVVALSSLACTTTPERPFDEAQEWSPQSAPVAEPRERGEQFGRWTEFLGDLDGDGVAEVAIADDDCTWIVSGRTRSLVDRVEGATVTDASDVDRDGIRDLLIFSPRWRSLGPLVPNEAHANPRAYVHVISGRDRRLIQDLAVSPEMWGAVDAGGDFDRDGVDDLMYVALAPNETHPARVPRAIEILSLVSGRKIASLMTVCDSESCDCSYKVLPHASSDHDPAVVVISYPTKWRDAYCLRCMSADGRTMWTQPCGRGDSCVGYSVVAGDWDADGTTDVIINAPALDGDGPEHPRPVRILSGRDGRELDRFESTESQAIAERRSFACGIALVRGARADGRPELWCGSVSTNFFASTGMLEVFGPNHEVERVSIPDGLQPGYTPFGNRLTSGQDVDGDGVDDVLVSGFGWYGGVSGGVLVISGKTRTILDSLDAVRFDREWARLIRD
jgi:hypothetical protein